MCLPRISYAYFQNFYYICAYSMTLRPLIVPDLLEKASLYVVVEQGQPYLKFNLLTPLENWGFGGEGVAVEHALHMYSC